MTLEQVIQYFENIPSSHRSLMLISGLTMFFIIENTFPFFKVAYNKWKHAGLNLFFTFTTVLINFSLAFILLNASTFVTQNHIGLFQWIHLPLPILILTSLILMDLIGAWLPHFLEHKVKWMWRFHLVHHSDRHVDTTTANRHHPGESIIRFFFTTLAVITLGAPIWMIFMYQSSSLIATQFSHSNMRFPEVIDNILKYILITPSIHRVHHHYRQPYTDSNYGNIFSIWDRLFGTLIEADNSQLIYGVDTHMDTKDSSDLVTLLRIPFEKYRSSLKYEEIEKLR